MIVVCVCVFFKTMFFVKKQKVIKNGGFVWGDETNTFQMSDINVEVEKGSLVMVLGGTGQVCCCLLEFFFFFFLRVGSNRENLRCYLQCWDKWRKLLEKWLSLMILPV